MYSFSKKKQNNFWMLFKFDLYKQFYKQKNYLWNCFFLNNIFCIWYNKKLQSIITSLIETKYMALCQINKIVIWTTWWLQKFHFLFQKSVHIFFKKNSLKINELIKNFKHHVCIKHINVQYYYIKKMIELEIVNVNYVFFFKTRQTFSSNHWTKWNSTTVWNYWNLRIKTWNENVEYYHVWIPQTDY